MPDHAPAAILFAAHGSSQPQAQAALDCIARLAARRFPGRDQHWAFTSKRIRRLGTADDPHKALERLAQAGVRRVAVQSLHVLPAGEYDRVLAQAAACREHFEALEIGPPLLAGPEDERRVAAVLAGFARPELQAGQAVVILGHGTSHAANAAYARLAAALRSHNPRLLLGLLEHGDGAMAMAEELLRLGCRRATITPLLFAAGQHTVKDLGGGASDSWRSVFTQAGIHVQAQLRGSAESEALAEIWLDHLEQALAAAEGRHTCPQATAS